MGRIFEVITKDTACALGSKKYIKRRTHFCSTRSFVDGMVFVDVLRWTDSMLYYNSRQLYFYECHDSSSIAMKGYTFPV